MDIKTACHMPVIYRAMLRIPFRHFLKSCAIRGIWTRVLAWCGMFLVANATAQTTQSFGGRSICKLATDYLRPRIYALDRGNGTNAGTLLALGTTNGAPLAEIRLGINPTDMAVTPGGDSLFVISAGSRTLSQIDLDTFRIVAVKPIDVPDTYYDSNPLYLALGRSNWVFYTDGAWETAIKCFDFAHGTNIAVTGGEIEIGGLASSRDGATLYSWHQSGWTAGNLNSWVSRYDASSPDLKPLEMPAITGQRDPLDTPILLNSWEDRVFNKHQMFSATKVGIAQVRYEENIYLISLDGDVAFGSTKVFDTPTAETLYTFPWASVVQALSGDQRKLFRYQAVSGDLFIYDMADIWSLNGPDIRPSPADNQFVSSPLDSLRWSASPIAVSYDLYFGTNQSQIAAASPASALYLGRVTFPTFALPHSLKEGASYFWRVDAIGYATTNSGPVWSFTVSTLAIGPPEVHLNSILGYDPPPVALTLTSPIPRTWTAAVSGSDWLTVDVDPNSSSNQVVLSFQIAAFDRGKYTNTVEITSDGQVFKVPVSVDILPLNIVRMVADTRRSYLYAVQPPAAPGESALLVFLNTETRAVDGTLPIGPSPTDLAIHYGEDRLYIANLNINETRVVDLNTRSLLPSLHLGVDVSRVNAGPPGRIIVEGYALVMFDTTTGAMVCSENVLPGDGKSDPSGLIYYHADVNPRAGLHKYLVTTNLLYELTYAAHPFGSRNLILSADASRLFWQGLVYDADVLELRDLGAEIYACSTNGSLAFSDREVYDTSTRQIIDHLPITTSILAVDGADRQLWYFDYFFHQVRCIPLDLLRSPKITTAPTDVIAPIGGNVQLSVVAMGLSPFSYKWLKNGALLSATNDDRYSATSIQLNQAGDYQVVVSNPYGAVTSAVARITVVTQPLIASQPQNIAVMAGEEAAFAVTMEPGEFLHYQWFVGGAPVPGATNSSLVIAHAQSSDEGAYYVVVTNIGWRATSQSASLHVQPAPLKIVTPPGSLTVAAGANASFDVGFQGTAPLSYQWFFGNDPLPGATSPRLTLTNVQAGNDGDYRFQITNQLGTAVTATATLKVLPAPPGFVIQPHGANLASGFDYSLEAQARGSDPISYQWRWDGKEIPGATLSALTLTNAPISASGDYDVVARNTLGASTSVVAFVNFTVAPPKFVVQPPASTEVMGGVPLLLTSLATGSLPLQYHWYFNNAVQPSQTNAQFSVASASLYLYGNYYVVVSNELGAATSTLARVVVYSPPLIKQGLVPQVVTAGNSVRLTVQAISNGAVTYDWWFNGNHLNVASSASLNLNNIQPSQAGYYQVLIQNAYGSTSSMAKVSVFGRAGRVIGWGDSRWHQTAAPYGLDDVVSVAGGEFHTLALRRDGSLIAWGNGDAGQTKIPNDVGRVVDIAAGAAHNLAIRDDGSVLAWGNNDDGQTQVLPMAQPALMIAAGKSHSLVLTASGDVIAFGDNSWGQTKVPAGLYGVRAIAAGQNHNLALRFDNTVVAWGMNSNHQASVPPGLNGVKAVAAGGFHSLALRSNGTVVAWGDNTFGQTNVPAGLTNVINIAAGSLHSIALCADGSVVVWGESTFGQALVPSNAHDVFAVAAGYNHNLAIAPALPRLLYHISLDGLVLEWQEEGIIQWASDAIGPYTDILEDGLIYTYTNSDMTMPQRFFRLRK